MCYPAKVSVWSETCCVHEVFLCWRNYSWLSCDMNKYLCNTSLYISIPVKCHVIKNIYMYKFVIFYLSIPSENYHNMPLPIDTRVSTIFHIHTTNIQYSSVINFKDLKVQWKLRKRGDWKKVIPRQKCKILDYKNVKHQMKDTCWGNECLMSMGE